MAGLAVTFRGMTARPDEHNCECHGGSAEELAQLKVPDVELDPDLLRRTWEASDWDDHASVLRRILPQLARPSSTAWLRPASAWARPDVHLPGASGSGGRLSKPRRCGSSWKRGGSTR